MQQLACFEAMLTLGCLLSGEIDEEASARAEVEMMRSGDIAPGCPPPPAAGESGPGARQLLKGER